MTVFEYCGASSDHSDPWLHRQRPGYQARFDSEAFVGLSFVRVVGVFPHTVDDVRVGPDQDAEPVEGAIDKEVVLSRRIREAHSCAEL